MPPPEPCCGARAAEELPVALVGRKNLGLRNDQHVELGRRALYLTPLNDVFGLRSRRSGRV